MNRVLIILILLLQVYSPTTRLSAAELPPSTSSQPQSVKTSGPGMQENFEYIKEKEKLGAKEFLRDTAIYYTAIWAFRFFYVRNKNSRIFDTSLSDWFDHITSKPVWNDGDSFVTNFVAHPFAGYMSYLYYSDMGHSPWVSALGSVVQSTLFEYTVEGTVETPSGIDLLATPLIGAPIGFIAKTTSDWLMKKDNMAAEVIARIINPMQNIIKDRKIVLFNPLTGSFEYRQSFSTSPPPAKKRSLKLDYPVFFESAIPRGYFQALTEVALLDGENIDGQLIFYDVKAEFPSRNYLYSIYIRVSQGGVNSFDKNNVHVDDGFEFANMLIGAKFMLLKYKTSVLSAGLEVVPPTAYKDNVDRLKSILNYKRDFPIYLKGAVTISPYISTAYWKDWFSVQSYLGMDIVQNADELEGDQFETRFRYSTAVGINVPYEFSPVIFTEFDGYTMVTADTFAKTDTFISAGMRFGERYNPGFTILVPVSGPTADVSNVSFVVDLKVRF